MAIPKTIEGREYTKFVDSPRGNGFDSVEVIVANDSSNPIPTESAKLTVFIDDVIDVTNTATPLMVGGANQIGRRRIIVQPKGGTIYISTDPAVTTGNNGTGLKLTNGSIVEFYYDDTTTLYGIKSGGGNIKTYVEEAK